MVDNFLSPNSFISSFLIYHLHLDLNACLPLYKKRWKGKGSQQLIRGDFNKFPDIFRIGTCSRLLKIQCAIAIHLMRWLTNFYDFSFKWTATAAIGMHPTKAWLSQLVNFKNAIWTWGHFRRTICNKILF